MPVFRILSFIIFFGLFSTAHALNVNDAAPRFRIPLMQDNPQLQANAGDLFESPDLLGSVVYVDFWASWCGPCRVSLPSLNTLFAEFSSRGFWVVAVNVDTEKQDGLDFLKKKPVDYPVLYDAEQGLPELFGVKGMPTAYLIDRTGQVRYIHEGFRSGDEKKLRAKIIQLLEEGQ
ncbi:TlpA family protein disulfide reductase [Spongiibacter sp. KMU-158]|uniref:TlpA family protein disulfide reductase n=1 Tax=Spongiibacter pelagi TaxID=2760804 RepID=A0A927C2K9_9GAMM|nr:TlpA disulfide reductase family protein [Spongiibacter pelagi]MBD2858877.1 TlpA family protein disulfide reductase [Spongiibacter pelagi]